MLSPEVCQLLGYWRSLGGGERLPDRCLLDLRELTHIMPWMFILEMREDGALVYRLAGSSLEGALGCSMAGKTYCSVFSKTEQATVMEELYATALVQSSGILRSGCFKMETTDKYDLEVISLPFADSRAMGGVILVGVVRPFEVGNHAFIDKWGEFDEQLKRLFVVPSPRIVRLQHLSKRVFQSLIDLKVTLRVMDLPRVMEIDDQGMHHKFVEVPSLSLDTFSKLNSQGLN
ncbi:MAG: PAS domain-containing protein [Kordiimonadaceae bacterium]|nr:PAS domain-containing protein [Kordiimonadaceae bacterium]